MPETWDDVTALVTGLSISNLRFCLPISPVGASSYVNPGFATIVSARRVVLSERQPRVELIRKKQCRLLNYGAGITRITGSRFW